MKKIVFLTGTRADFGKIKSLIEIALNTSNFEVHIFATGMHLRAKYGRTVDEIYKCGYPNIYQYINHHDYDSMDSILACTINGFSNYVKELSPDLIVVHGDRVEALAGAIVGALNNILVAHIEGGEVSGTIDELIRHSVSKLSHVHFVANDIARNRLIQMGECENSIFVIGSPDIDVMLSNNLPTIDHVKEHYGIKFSEYAIVMFHPVTTEVDNIGEQADNLVKALIESGRQYIVVYPNNDLGSDTILKSYKALKANANFLIFPSIRFEYFIVLLKYAQFIIGNSSAGIREAPYYGIPTINIGTRQNNRAVSSSIMNTGYSCLEIKEAIAVAQGQEVTPSSAAFGSGNSDKLFVDVLQGSELWQISKQKIFKDLVSI